MKQAAFLLLLALLAAGCGNRKSGPPGVFPDESPIVRVAPVQTVPFEEGNKAGYAAGVAAATPKAPLPPEEKIAAEARAAALLDPGRNEKWQRGYVDGYMAGYRSIATGQK